MSPEPWMKRLRVRAAPVAAEGLPEYLLRLADLNGLRNVTRLLRLTRGGGTGLGSPGQLAAVTGQPEAVIVSLGRTSDVHWKGDRRTRSYGSELGAYARVCVQCLEEEGVRRHAWRYPYSLCCLKHAIMLSDACASCDRPITLTRGTATRCVCGHLLHEAKRRAASAQVIEAQHRLVGGLVPPDHGVTAHPCPIDRVDLAAARDLLRSGSEQALHDSELAIALAALRLVTHPGDVRQALCAGVPIEPHQAAHRHVADACVEASAFRVLDYLAGEKQQIDARCLIDWHRSHARRISPCGLTPPELSRETGLPRDVISALLARGVLPWEKHREGAWERTIIPNDGVSAFLAELKRHMTHVELTTTLRINDCQARQLLIFGVVRQWCLSEPYSDWSLVPFEDVARLLSRLRRLAQSVSPQPVRSGELIALNRLGMGSRRRERSLGRVLIHVLRGELDVIEVEAAGTGLDCFAVSEDAMIRIAAGLPQHAPRPAIATDEAAVAWVLG